MDTKPILKTAVGLGALSLAVDSSKMLKNSMKSKPMKIKPIVKGTTKLMIGTALLDATSSMIK